MAMIFMIHGSMMGFVSFASNSWDGLPSGKHTKNYGKSPFFMGKLTISMAIFNSYFDITRGYQCHQTWLAGNCRSFHGAFLRWFSSDRPMVQNPQRWNYHLVMSSIAMENGH